IGGRQIAPPQSSKHHGGRHRSPTKPNRNQERGSGGRALQGLFERSLDVCFASLRDRLAALRSR
ncbi:hypothetical protein GW17_00031653, partial [Ensete ventricosum]